MPGARSPFFLPSFIDRMVPDIVDDIVYLILKTAIEQDRHCALELVLLARHVQKWIDPLLYRVIEIRTEGSLASLVWTITSSLKTPDFFALHVQKLLIFGPQSMLDIAAVAAACTGVHSLAIWSEYNQPLELNMYKSLRRLSLFGRETTPLLPASSSLIHAGIAPLTKLTHLSVVLPENRTIVMFVAELTLRIPRRVRTILIYLDVLHQAEDIIDIPVAWFTNTCDSRVTLVLRSYLQREGLMSHALMDLILFRRHPSFFMDWGHNEENEPDVWEIAQEMQESRKIIM
ncbi:hypothetical protein C8J56DRAFT_954011 [Mycena floridula]|nr:hypothetical protein C8J56DRAFT_954011 [Mycena floridula]